MKKLLIYIKNLLKYTKLTGRTGLTISDTRDKTSIEYGSMRYRAPETRSRRPKGHSDGLDGKECSLSLIHI